MKHTPILGFYDLYKRDIELQDNQNLKIVLFTACMACIVVIGLNILF